MSARERYAPRTPDADFAAFLERFKRLSNAEDLEGVALVLREEGVKGKRSEPCSCPVARFLTGAEGIESVDAGFHVVTGRTRRDHRVRATPQPVAEFMREFDAGDWPEFDERPGR